MDSTFTQRVQELAARIEPYLIEKRRFFHAHPELSGEEVNTTAAIAQELDAMGIEYALPNDFIPGPAPAQYTESENLASLKEAGKAFVRQGVEAQGGSTISSQSGLIVTIRGEAPDAYDEQGRPRHRIVLRSDIDALPILEQTWRVICLEKRRRDACLWSRLPHRNDARSNSPAQ